MKILRNEKLIERNATIGQWASLTGVLIVFGTLAYSAASIFNPETVTETSQTTLLAVLFVGIVLSQVSMYLGSRFGRRPRPHEALDAALQGIPGDYTIYHYVTPIPHLLAGPAGVWVLIPYHQRGSIAYQKNRWRNFGGGFAQSYLRILGQEGLGRPDLEAENQIARVEKLLKKNLADGETLPIVHAALVFLDPEIEITAEGAPIPALQVKKLKEHLRKAAKEAPLPQADLDRIKAALPKG